MLICAFMLSLSVHVFTFLVVKATKTIQRTTMAKTPKKTPHVWPQNPSQNWVSTRNKQPGTLSWEALLRKRPQSVWHNEYTSKISQIRVKFPSENGESLPKMSEKLRFSDVTWIYMMQFTPKKGRNHVDAAFRWTPSFSQGSGSFEWMPPANPGISKSTTCWGTAIGRKCILGLLSHVSPKFQTGHRFKHWKKLHHHNHTHLQPYLKPYYHNPERRRFRLHGSTPGPGRFLRFSVVRGTGPPAHGGNARPRDRSPPGPEAPPAGGFFRWETEKDAFLKKRFGK